MNINEKIKGIIMIINVVNEIYKIIQLRGIICGIKKCNMYNLKMTFLCYILTNFFIESSLYYMLV